MQERNMPKALNSGDSITIVVDAVTAPILAWTEAWIAAGYVVTLVSYEAWVDTLANQRPIQQEAVLFLCAQEMDASLASWFEQAQAQGVLIVGTRYQRYWLRWLWDRFMYPTFYVLRHPQAMWWKEEIEAWERTLSGHLRIIEPLVEPPRGHVGAEFGGGILMGAPAPVPSGGEPLRTDSDVPVLWLMDSQDVVDGVVPPTDGSVQGVVWFGPDVVGDSVPVLELLSAVPLKQVRILETEDEVEDESFICYIPVDDEAYPLLPYGTMLHFRSISNSMVVPFYVSDLQRK